jgi:ubiquinone/menaquinone biosynthesis C-methylase UbiE
MKNRLIRRQFDRQALKFASWEPGRNTRFMEELIDFCEITGGDRLLDVACGPGDFTVFAAKGLTEACGVDISAREIRMARRSAARAGASNVTFICSDVESLPYADGYFSVVLSKSAFHHFASPGAVFREMRRCCISNGTIAIQDIVSFDDPYTDYYFQILDKLVDRSHNRVLSIEETDRLFSDNNVLKTRESCFEAVLHLGEYIGHASQSRRDRAGIEEHIKTGLADASLSGYLFSDRGEVYLRRRGYLVSGRKD